MPTLVCSLAVTSATFLIAVEYILVTSFNQVLVVTVLGKQVREALEAPQLLLLLLLLGAALLTVSLCATLMLRGRRDEISLLSMVGWERRVVLLRLMWDCWWPALLSGEVGGLLVLGATTLGGELPPLVTIAGLLACTPITGLLLVSLAAIGPAWQETRRVFLWR
jgi:cell division protein FtsX